MKTNAVKSVNVKAAAKDSVMIRVKKKLAAILIPVRTKEPSCDVVLN